MKINTAFVFFKLLLYRIFFFFSFFYSHVCQTFPFGFWLWFHPLKDYITTFVQFIESFLSDLKCATFYVLNLIGLLISLHFICLCLFLGTFLNNLHVIKIHTFWLYSSMSFENYIHHCGNIDYFHHSKKFLSSLCGQSPTLIPRPRQSLICFVIICISFLEFLSMELYGIYSSFLSVFFFFVDSSIIRLFLFIAK